MKTTYLYLFALVLLIPAASAQIQLDGISTDPAIIAAGDTVDVIVEYTANGPDDRFGDSEWRFLLELASGNQHTEEFIDIQDASGQDRYATLGAQATKTKVYRIKVSENAPTGLYQFELRSRWMHNQEVLDGYEVKAFELSVTKQAIVLSIADIVSTPSRLVPGTRQAALTVRLSNAGVKDAHNVKVALDLPEGFTPTHTTSNQAYIGTIQALHTATSDMHVDIDETVTSGEHRLSGVLLYQDASQNEYQKTVSTKIYIAKKPRLHVDAMLIQGAPASTIDMVLNVTNTGVVAAEAIDVRVLKESNQPFSLQTRSGYIGRLDANSSAQITISAEIERHAQPGEYNIPVLIRAKGDSRVNDDMIYTYRDSVDVVVTQSHTNSWVLFGIALVLLYAVVFVWRKLR